MHLSSLPNSWKRIAETEGLVHLNLKENVALNLEQVVELLDLVYTEHLLEPLLQTISALSGPKTTILVRYIQYVFSLFNFFRVSIISNFSGSLLDSSGQDNFGQLYVSPP